MSVDAKAFLKELHQEVDTHPAVNHVFLARCATSPFTREDYRVMGLQHYPLVGLFTTYMEWLLIGAPDSDCKQWVAKVLVDEYGEGSEGLDHAVLYRKYLDACGVEEGEEDRVPLDSRVRDFVRTHLDMVTQEHFLVGLGALGPGHEWAIPKMFPPLIAGLRRAGFSDAEINYFLLHVVQDEDHGAWMEEALVLLIRTHEDADRIREGTLRSLEARHRFWDGVQFQVVNWRQPDAGAARNWLWAGGLFGGTLLGGDSDKKPIYRPQLRAMAERLRPSS